MNALKKLKSPRKSKPLSKPNALVVVGTVAIDAVETPFGKRDQVFGGSAAYFSYAASFFTQVAVVAVVGRDFPEGYRQILMDRGIDLSHLQIQNGKTFFWRGKYEGDLNSAQTLETQLNTLLTFNPVLRYKQPPEFLFLANIDPVLQGRVIHQLKKNGLKYTAMDTMNFWIQNKQEGLLKVLKQVDCIVINDGEAKMLSGESHMIKAARKIAALGPRHVIIKKGEHGVFLLYEKEFFVLPAFPVDNVLDPTGAGDSFAGGLMGYLTLSRDTSLENMKRAIAAGTIVASFTVQDFGLEALQKITRKDLELRLDFFQKMCSF